ncbi:MAG: CARDB domain-containing protein, partial [Calditrichota bacterium]
DVSATGTDYGIYVGSSSGNETIENNIFYIGESSNTCYGIYGLLSSYAPNTLDYNAYYGTGTGYNLAKLGTPVYANLAALQSGTTYEAHGVEGDPGFTSSSDLHILNTQGLVSNNGLAINGIVDDYDGDTRLATPDIGADEYTYLAPANDYAVLEILDLQTLYPELTALTIQARVQNRGSAAQTDVPVRLFYDGVQQGSDVLVSLNPNDVTTVDLPWTTPAARDTGILEVQCFLGGDVDLNNDSIAAQVVVVGQPMHGSYDIGGGNNDYANFTMAIDDMTLRTIDGAVTFNVFPQTYNESINITAVTGVSSNNTISFVASLPVTPPELVGAGPVVRLDGATYVTFDGIDITANTSARVVLILNGSSYNTFQNLTVTGNDVSSTSSYGIDISGGGNNYNMFDNVTVGGCYYGVRFYGSSSNSDLGNVFQNGSVVEGKYATYLYYQNGSSIHHCDLQPGWTGANTEIYGVYCSSHATGTVSEAYANQIHNIRSATTCNGIYAGSGSGQFKAYNNFVYDYQGPTGTAVLYGLRAAAGTSEWYFNSVYIGDVPTTGNIYGFYITGTSTVATLQNNVIQIEEPVEECWGIYISGGTLTSDYNAFYSSGPGALYNVGFLSATNYATLALWQGTGYDTNSREGNPGYLSSTDLHIAPTFSLLNGVGTAIAGITDDIDGETRGTPPDIGADEYVFTSLPHDYGVNGFVGLSPTYVNNVPVVIQAVVENYGSLNETNVPVRLYYNNNQQDEVLVSLNAGTNTTVDLDWTPPVTDYEVGELKVKAFCPSDGFNLNDSTTASVTIVGAPMSGMYDLGGGNLDFANFNEAVSALTLRGIDGEVIIDCYEGTYDEIVEIPEITGASFTDRIIFQAHQGALDDIVTLTSTGGAQILYFNGADYITFDGIDIIAAGSVNINVTLDNGADFITLQNLTITGRDSTSTSIKGVKLTFNGNDDCVLDNVTISGVCYGLRCETGTGQSDRLEVKNCHVSGAAYCIYIDDHHNARIHDNDLQPHAYSTTSSAYGVYCANLTAEDTAYVYNNRIHNLRHLGTSTSPTVAGIWAGSNSVLYIYNNFIWDWQINGQDGYGVYGSTGQTFCYHNTIRMNDVPAADGYAGIYTGTGTFTAVNNIIEVVESVDTCYGIWRASGTLLADYNCYHGTGAGFRTGRDASVEFTTLLDWQGLGQDIHGIAGDPGFVADGDPHINISSLLVNNVGLYIPEVVDDIDGDLRIDPPDIGADEYEGLVQPEAVDSLTIAVDAENNDVILRWTASADANSYKIYADTDADVLIDPSTLVGHTNALTFTHEDVLLLGDDLRCYVVIASSDPPPAAALSGSRHDQPQR